MAAVAPAAPALCRKGRSVERWAEGSVRALSLISIPSTGQGSTWPARPMGEPAFTTRRARPGGPGSRGHAAPEVTAEGPARRADTVGAVLLGGAGEPRILGRAGLVRLDHQRGIRSTSSPQGTAGSDARPSLRSRGNHGRRPGAGQPAARRPPARSCRKLNVWQLRALRTGKRGRDARRTSGLPHRRCSSAPPRAGHPSASGTVPSSTRRVIDAHASVCWNG